MNAISRKFKSTRKKLNLTQYKFSELLGVSQGYLSDVENGKKVPSVTLLLLLGHVSRGSTETNFVDCTVVV